MSAEPSPDGTPQQSTVLTLCRSRRVERVWHPGDALLYNMMVMNVVMGFALAFLTACLFYPEGNWVIATAISAVFCSAEALVYAFLAASMPRSGGEYYFQARILSTGTGSVFCFSAVVLGGTMWVAVTGWCAAHLAVGPLLVSLGVAVHSEGLIRAAAWSQGSWGVLLLSIVVIVWSAVAIILGLRTYTVLQRAFWAAAGVTLLAVLVGLLRVDDVGASRSTGRRQPAHCASGTHRGRVRTSVRLWPSYRSRATCSCMRDGARSRREKRRGHSS